MTSLIPPSTPPLSSDDIPEQPVPDDETIPSATFAAAVVIVTNPVNAFKGATAVCESNVNKKL